MFEEKYRADNEQIRLDTEADGRILAALQQEETVPVKKSGSKTWTRLIAAAAAVAILTGAAFGVSKLSGKKIPVNRAELPIATPAPSVTYADVLAVIKALQQNRGGDTYENGDLAFDGASDLAPAPAVERATANADSEKSGADTKTNTQYADVDEADVVKTDGEYLYILRQNEAEVAIVKADGENTRRVGTIQLDRGGEDNWSYSNNMYYYNDRLVLIYTVSKRIQRDAPVYGDDELRINVDYFWYPTAQVTHTAVYDVSDRTAPRLLADYGQDGWLTDSRMVDGVLYLCSDYSGYSYYRGVDLIDDKDPSSFVPTLYDGDKESPVPESSLCVIKDPQDAGYAVLTAVKVADTPERLSEKAVLGGGGNTLYANSTHLLLGSPRWDYYYETAGLGNGKTRRTWRSRTRTVLTLFSLNGGNLSQTADGEIDGYLDGQFSIDEFEGYFRIAATVQESFGSYVERDWNDWQDYSDYDNEYRYQNDQHNALYVLDGSLKEVGRVDDLAPDETIRSVRFQGDIGYVVTFRQTDPLFAIDLSNPKKPKVLSALKITGFSEYLHPFGEDRLLGFGQDGTEDGVNGKLKLVMFDTSDKTDVSVCAKQVLPFKNCWSPALYDHHAILPDTSRSLIGVAVQSWDWEYDLDSVFYILYSYSEEEGFEEAVRIPLNNGDYVDTYSVRGLFLGDCFYLAGSNGVQAFDGGFERIAKVTF